MSGEKILFNLNDDNNNKCEPRNFTEIQSILYNKYNTIQILPNIGKFN